MLPGAIDAVTRAACELHILVTIRVQQFGDVMLELGARHGVGGGKTGLVLQPLLPVRKRLCPVSARDLVPEPETSRDAYLDA
jgi:hypothetical protein